MAKELDFGGRLHKATKRDYIGRVVEHSKADCAARAKQWGYDYWDGERQFGYGGYSYDGRWRPVAQDIADHYGLKAGDRVLDVGCGKAYLLYELTQVVPGLDVTGLDISRYAIEHAKPEVQPFLHQGSADSLPFDSDSFDCVISLTTLHNLKIDALFSAVTEIARVLNGDKGWLMVESYRNEAEKANLLYWQLTCESFYSPEEWQWIYRKCGYTGDFGFIYFE